MKATFTLVAVAAPRVSTRAAAVPASAAAMSAISPRKSAPRVQRPVMSDPPRSDGAPANLRPDSGLAFTPSEQPCQGRRGRTRGSGGLLDGLFVEPTGR